MLIPQYNEASNGHMEARLTYFKNIADTYKDILDVVIIDDGSTDDSLEYIKDFHIRHNSSFYVGSVYPNAQKVGALFLTVLAIEHEFVILSDFDTDIFGLGHIYPIVKRLTKDDKLMGCYFRMLPFEGSGSVFLFQQLEYSLLRVLYKMHQKEQSVSVMPGAGCCYKRQVLVSIYNEHSGIRNGEDREATLLGHKLGYRTIYVKNILTLTRPPLNFKSLIKQRIRWNLGYIETFYKERRYYLSQIKNMNSVGARTLLDAIAINLIIFTPFIVLAALIFNWHLSIIFLTLAYLGSLMYGLNAFVTCPEESAEFKKKRLFAVFYFPFYKMLLDWIAWTSAFATFFRRKKGNKGEIKTETVRKKKPHESFVDIE